jgi:hypothetical protein
MEIASRTTEGLPNECAVCGKQVWIVPSIPPGDATCPHCGTAIWFSDATGPVRDVLHQLQERGAIVETDDQDQIHSIRLIGGIYTDAAVELLGKLTGVRTLDVSHTGITTAGIARLQSLLPETKIMTGRNAGDNASP